MIQVLRLHQHCRQEYGEELGEISRGHVENQERDFFLEKIVRTKKEDADQHLEELSWIKRFQSGRVEWFEMVFLITIEKVY